MTTIILVIVGVLIAAASALFMIYYGGEIFGEGATRAEAARLVSEGQQISYATSLYYRQEGKMPGLMPDGQLNGAQALIDLQQKDYIESLPAGSKLVDADDWNMEYGTDGMIYTRVGPYAPLGPGDAPETTDAALNVCKQARKQLGYSNFENVYRCDGTDYFDSSWHTRGTLPDREPCCIRD